MKLANAARFFNDDRVYDAYTGRYLFSAHSAAHNDKSSAGAVARRRTLIMDPLDTLPARRVLRIYSEIWLAGGSIADSFSGQEVQRSVTLKKSTGLMTLLSPGQAASGAAGTELHTHNEYFRDVLNVATRSDYDAMWSIFCAEGEAVQQGVFLERDGVLYRARHAYLSVDEFLIAEADEFNSDARQDAVFAPASGMDFGAPTTGAPVTVAVIQTDVQKYYEFPSDAQAGTKIGDRSVFIAKSAYTPNVGDNFSMLGADWRVVLVVSEADAWVVQARLV